MIAALHDLPDLRSFSLEVYGIYASLAECPLRNLYSGLTRLTDLRLFFYLQRGFSVASLANLRNLVLLNIGASSETTIDGLSSALSDKPMLESLRIYCIGDICSSTCLASMQRLTSVILHQTDIDGAFFLSLESAPLTTLQLRDVKGINSVTMQGTYKLERLEKLVVSACTDLDYSGFFNDTRSLRTLRYVTILANGVPVSDVLMENIKRAFPCCRRYKFH